MNILFFLTAFVSEVIGTMAGFGSSTIFLPLALLFFYFKTALALVAFLHIFGNLGRISFFRHGIDWNLVLKFGLPSVLLTLTGALLVNYIPQEILKGLLGLFLTFYAGLSLWKDTLQTKASTLITISGGAVSGFLAGLIGTGGALRGAFLTAFGLPKEKYIATAATIALAVDFTRIPVYISEGFLKSGSFRYLPVLFVVAFAGSFTGRRIIKRIPQKQFRKFVLIVIFLIGIRFIYNWVLLRSEL